MLADILAQNRAWGHARKQIRKAHKQQVYACADRVFLAVYKERPQHEIDELLAQLAAATTGQVV